MDSLRIGLGKVVTLALVAASAACSSSSSSAPPGPTSDGGGTSDGGIACASTPVTTPPAGSTPVKAGTGGTCPTQTTATFGTKITLAVTWPATEAVVKGTCGEVDIWLLSKYNVDPSNHVTGTTTTCGNTTPPIVLSSVADSLTGLPPGSQVQNVFPASSWAAVPSSNITGTLGGWDIGSSVQIDPVVTLYGLSSTSTLTNASTTWPGSASDLSPGDLTFADGTPYLADAGSDGVYPGVLALPNGAAPFVLPKTALSSSAPAASQLYVVLRTALTLYGTGISCSEQTGTAYVSQLNNHVLGCDLENDGGPCTAAQSAFIDGNTTQYVPNNGTFDSKQLADSAACSDVLAALQ